MNKTTRTVFFVSDGTGITAETFGKAILAQFEIQTRLIRVPFTDTVDKAHQAVRQINHVADLEKRKPIVFTTLVNMEALQVIQNGCQGMWHPRCRSGTILRTSHDDCRIARHYWTHDTR